MRRYVLFLLVLTAWPSTARAAFTFTPGHYYSTTPQPGMRTILEYAPDGTIVGSLDVAPSAADELRGIAFGPDGLLYVTTPRGNGFAVLALDAAGTIRQTYTADAPYLGNTSMGKLVVDRGNVYVAAAVVSKFRVGAPESGESIYSPAAYEVGVLPSGNLLVPVASNVYEITPTGQTVHTIQARPNVHDIRGAAYDPATDKLFVADYGSSADPYAIRRINMATGEVEKSVQYTYGDDVFLTAEGNLLVGSRTLAPRLYSHDLELLDTLDGAERMFVTQYVPEPGALWGVGALFGALLLRHRAPKD